MKMSIKCNMQPVESWHFSSIFNKLNTIGAIAIIAKVGSIDRSICYCFWSKSIRVSEINNTIRRTIPENLLDIDH
jgi:hypothetical protein